MSPYVAQRQSLFGQVGAPNPPTSQIDVAGAIDALTSGATSLIHNVMLRREADRAQAARHADLALRSQQMTLEQQRAAREATNQDRDYALRQESERHRFIEAGGIPAHTETQAVPGTAAIGALNAVSASPVARAMQSGTAAGLPPMRVTPSAPAPMAEPSTTTVYHPDNVDVPESFDPTRSASYQRGVAEQELRNEGYQTRQEFRAEQQRERLAAQQSGREYMANAARSLAQLRASLSNAKGGVAKAMTGNQLEKAREQAATGLLSIAGGSFDTAISLLNNTSQGKALRDLGVEPRHLMYAHAEYVKGASTQALRLQSGIAGLPAPAAADDVTVTRRLLGGVRAIAGGQTDTASAARPPIMTPGAPAEATRDTSSSGDDFTDDEVRDAWQNGMRTDKQIR